MKKTFLYPLLFFGILLATLFSCSDDNVVVDPPPPPSAMLTLNIDLPKSSSSGSNPETGEIYYEYKYTIGDMADLFLVIHKVEDESFVQFQRADLEQLTIEGGILTWDKIFLPFGKYYITLIANSEEVLDAKLLSKLSDKYSNAVCQVPCADIFYKTFEIEMQEDPALTAENVLSHPFTKSLTLELLTKGRWVYLISDWDKVPKDAKVEAMAEIKDLPSAFFIKTGKTLTTEEHKSNEVFKYSNTFSVTEVQEKLLFVSYPLLSNSELEDVPEEKGQFTFTFMQDEELIKTEKIEMPHLKEDVNFELYTIASTLYEESRAGE